MRELLLFNIKDNNMKGLHTQTVGREANSAQSCDDGIIAITEACSIATLNIIIPKQHCHIGDGIYGEGQLLSAGNDLFFFFFGLGLTARLKLQFQWNLAPFKKSGSAPGQASSYYCVMPLGSKCRSSEV